MSCCCPLMGGLAGLVTWGALLEGPKMGGIIFRVNAEGKRVFTPGNIVEYIKAPFKYDYFWNENFLQHNWIVMCAGGMTAGYLASRFPLN